VNAVLTGALHGLHAAHEARDARGEPLHIVHRDVSPQNILVGTDGVSRVLDFGVAKAAARLQTTEEGKMKGKLAYMAPEQLRAQEVDRRADVFAAGIVHWEALTGRRLFSGGDVGVLMGKVLNADIPLPSSVVPEIPSELDDLVMRALERDPSRRYQTAREYAIAIETVGPIALARHVGEWVERVGGDALSDRSSKVANIEKLGDSPEYASEEQLANTRARLRADPGAFTGRPSGPQLIVGARELEGVVRPPSIPTVALGAAAAANAGETTAADVPTVSAVPATKASSSGSRQRAAGLAALGLLAAISVVWGATRSHEPSTVAPLPAAEISAATMAAQPSAVPRQEPASPSASATAAMSASASAPPAIGGAVPKAHPAAIVPHASVRHRDCNPPWVLDAKGIRRVKPQCT
jgi:serine/threonine-protein kinase